MILRKYISFLICLFVSTAGLQAQKGFSVGPAIGGGVGYSKNFILDDTSQYYIKNGLGMYVHGGLDLSYGLDDNISFTLGGQFRYKQFNLAPPELPGDLSFDVLNRTLTSISIPMMVHYRFPIGSSGNKYFKISAGHSLDLITGDSIVEKTPSDGVIDSAGSFTRHEFQILERKNPTVLLGGGLDIQSESGNVLNISLMWGIGTGQIFRGSVKEWAFLNKSFDPNGQLDEPEEFPEHYYEWGLKGSTVSLRISYMFSLGSKEKGEGEDDSEMEDSEPEIEDSDSDSKEVED